MYLETDEIDKAYDPLVSRGSINGASISPFVILCVLRRVVNLRLYSKSNIEKVGRVWLNLLIEFLSLERQSTPDEFIQAKAAMCACFGLVLSDFPSAPIELSRLIDGNNLSYFVLMVDFANVLSKFYSPDESAFLSNVIQRINEILPSVVRTSLQHVNSLLV
jgi:hypothetical protein